MNGRKFPNLLNARFINPVVVTKWMSLSNDYSQWLKRGRQRTAIARVLRKPMTATEICAAARTLSPQIQLRDIWFLMRQFEGRGLAICLNPKQVTGKLYCLTDKGRTATRHAFGITIPSPSSNIDWRKYSWVIRAKIRRLALCTLEQAEQKTGEAQTATEIRKHVLIEHPAGLNPVLHAVRELAERKLIVCVGMTPVRGCKLYRLTPSGRAIVKQLRQ